MDEETKATGYAVTLMSPANFSATLRRPGLTTPIPLSADSSTRAFPATLL